jgi:hypothetical protein
MIQKLIKDWKLIVGNNIGAIGTIAAGVAGAVGAGAGTAAAIGGATSSL